MKHILASFIFLFSFSSLAFAPIDEITKSPHSSYKSYNKKNWYWSFFSIATEPSKALKNGYGSLFSYNYFKAKRYIGRSSSIAFVPTFNISTAGKRTEKSKVKGGAIEIGDFYSEYQYSAYSNSFLKAKIGARIYLPLSFSSKKKNLKTRSQLYASIGAYPFYKIQAYYKAEANSYFYKGRTYQNKSNKVVGKKNSKLYHFFSLSYLTSDKFSVSSRVGQEIGLYEKTTSTDSSRMTYSADMSIRWNMAYKMSISLGLQNKISNKQSFKDLLALSTSEVSVITSILF